MSLYNRCPYITTPAPDGLLGHLRLPQGQRKLSPGILHILSDISIVVLLLLGPSSQFCQHLACQLSPVRAQTLESHPLTVASYPFPPPYRLSSALPALLSFSLLTSSFYSDQPHFFRPHVQPGGSCRAVLCRSLDLRQLLLLCQTCLARAVW